MPENTREGNEGLEGGLGKPPEQINKEHLEEFVRVTAQCFELEEKGVDIDTLGTLDELIPGFKEGVKGAFSDWMMEGLKQKHGDKLLGPKTEEQAINEGYEPQKETTIEETETVETIDETLLFSPTTVDTKGNIVEGYEYYDNTIHNYLKLGGNTTNEVFREKGEELNHVLDQYIIDFSVFLFEFIDTHQNIQEHLNPGNIESLEYFRLFINHAYVGKIHGTIDEKINIFKASRGFEGNFSLDSQEDISRFKDVLNLNRKTHLLTIQESFYSEGFIDIKTQTVKIDGEQKQLSIPTQEGQKLFMEEMLKYISSRTVTENRYYNSDMEGEEITQEDYRIQEALNKGLYQMILDEGYQISTVRKNAEIKYSFRLETNREKYFEQGSHEGINVTEDNRNQVKEIEYTTYLKTAGSRLYEDQFLEATRSILTDMEYGNINFGRLMKNTEEIKSLISSGEVFNGEFASKVSGYVPLFIAGALEGVGDMASFVFNSVQEGTNDIYNPNKTYETPPPINNVIRKSIIDITVVIGKEVGELVTDPLEAIPELILGIDTILNDMEWGVVYDMVKQSFNTPHEAVYHTVQVIGLAYILLRMPSKINSLRQVYSAERIAIAEELVTNVEFGKIVQRINTRPKKMPTGPTMKTVETTKPGVIAGAVEGVHVVSKAIVEPIDRAYDSVKGVSRILNNLQKKFRTLEKFSQKTLTLEGAMGVSMVSGNVIEKGMEEGILSDSFIEQAGFTDEEKELYIDSYKPSESIIFQDQRDKALEAMEESTDKIMEEFYYYADYFYENIITNLPKEYNLSNEKEKILINTIKGLGNEINSELLIKIIPLL